VRNQLISIMALVFTTAGCCGSNSTVAPPSVQSFEVLDAVAIGAHSMEFYVHYTLDAAILGFAITDGAGVRQYCPMYGSTYRGLPAVSLEIHASESREEVWVTSTWKGYESLAYHRFGSGSCITGYGDQLLLSTPNPGSLSSSSATMPPLDPATTTVLGTLDHDPDDPAPPRG